MNVNVYETCKILFVGGIDVAFHDVKVNLATTCPFITWIFRIKSILSVTTNAHENTRIRKNLSYEEEWFHEKFSSS